VLLPERASRWEYALLLVVPFLLLPWLFHGDRLFLLPGLLLLPALVLVTKLFRATEGATLNRLLAATAGLQLLLGLTLSLALLFR